MSKKKQAPPGDVPEGEYLEAAQVRYLKLTVFLCGMSVMGIEMSASRLLAPYFGTSLFIWTNLIGAIMAALSLGYWVGGKVADRHPRTEVFYRIVLGAGLLVAAVPYVTQPVMAASTHAITTGDVGVVVGSLVATILLFALPIFLLGMISPYAVRLATHGEAVLGSTAGSLYALSTLGSIVGTFLPALATIPWLGTRKTILAFAAVLVAAGAVGTRRRNVAVIPIVIALVYLLPFGPIQAGGDLGPEARLLEEDESLYHYIQVIEKQGRRLLVLNEGRAVHSIYETRDEPWTPLVGSVWDSMSALPLFLDKPPGSRIDVLIVGLAAGTISKQLFHFFGDLYDLHIDGVEIDGRIIDFARRYFAMNEPGLQVFVQDGRVFLTKSEKKWDLIMCDAYRQPYIPFHLATKEYFQLIREHLTPGGYMSINVGSIHEEGAVLQRIISTVAHVYGEASVMKVANPAGTHFDNYVVVAGEQRPDPARLDVRVEGSLAKRVIDESGNQDLARTLLQRIPSMRLAEVAPGAIVLEDDRAPVEVLTDMMIAEFAARGPATRR